MGLEWDNTYFSGEQFLHLLHKTERLSSAVLVAAHVHSGTVHACVV